MLPIQLLSTAQKQTIVKALFDFPARQWSVPDLEDWTKLPHATVYRQVKKLADLGVLRQWKVNRKSLVYKLVQSPLTRELKRSLQVYVKTSKAIANEFLKQLPLKKFKAVILYGSVVQNTAHAYSDIDILVVVEKRSKIFEKSVHDVATEISVDNNKTISVMFMTEKESKGKNQFTEQVKKHMKVLHGTNPF